MPKDHDDEGNEGQESTDVDEEEKEQKIHKRSFKSNLQRSKRSLKTIRFYEDEVIKLKTLTRRRTENRLSNFCSMPKNWSSDFPLLRKSDVRIFSFQNQNRSSDFFKPLQISLPILENRSYLENRLSGFYFYCKKMTIAADSND
ncbi:hypothetical protein M9H77_19362 [Catharanthus roseus]|uniref:Uncharacterized protein n=1 Tax=Catharanthus roseus TaxID=4058 RepID=A0ACC0BA35_CATRO|nr:hypothetical protein M9H77_19362 [Catharanthus roseus]